MKQPDNSNQVMPAPPPELSDAARQEWDRVTAEMARLGIIGTLDRAALASYCGAYALWADANDKVRQFGVMMKGTNGRPTPSPYLEIVNNQAAIMLRIATSFGFSSATARDFDLFGAPVRQIRERWGRPSFAKNRDNQELVALLRSAGWTEGRIAQHLGCDVKTLKKHFARELARGADLIEAMALQVNFQKMREGNSVAIGRMLEILNRGHAEPPAASKPKEEKLGKKEMANIAAATAHENSGWGDLLH